jgi:AAA15 family ATPase/GTPase
VGPNGSGKSSIVTALSICLGGDIKSLNRQADIQALINHDTNVKTAEVEIELFFREKDNIVVRTEFGRDRNSQTWTVNGKDTSRQVCTVIYTIWDDIKYEYTGTSKNKWHFSKIKGNIRYRYLLIHLSGIEAENKLFVWEMYPYRYVSTGT